MLAGYHYSESRVELYEFCLSGSICGHTFAVNEKGIVNTVNNIRAVYRPQGLPRQILARASLNANTLDEAITILTGQPRSGGRFTIRSGSWAMRGCSALRPPVKAVPFYP
ncbi:carcinine hydrolase/isopenicillin-N N-acyltransferase family protein [Escherichia coli]